MPLRILSQCLKFDVFRAYAKHKKQKNIKKLKNNGKSKSSALLQNHNQNGSQIIKLEIINFNYKHFLFLVMKMELTGL